MMQFLELGLWWNKIRVSGRRYDDEDDDDDNDDDDDDVDDDVDGDDNDNDQYITLAFQKTSQC